MPISIEIEHHCSCLVIIKTLIYLGKKFVDAAVAVSEIAFVGTLPLLACPTTSACIWLWHDDANLTTAAKMSKVHETVIQQLAVSEKPARGL